MPTIRRPQPSSRRWLTTVGLACALTVGGLTGWFITYATAVNHPIAKAPIPVDFCFWVSHPEIFKGQPVLTEAKYTQLIEGGAIDKEECENIDVSHFWPPSGDPVRADWEKDLRRNFYTAEFELSFVGTIPAHPRYAYWIQDAKNRWMPTHSITTFRVDRLTAFKRIQ